MPVDGNGDGGLTAVGPRIRAARRVRGLTLKELADQVGVTPGHISQIERGITCPSVGALLAIAETLAEPICNLFNDTKTCSETHALPMNPRDDNATVLEPPTGISMDSETNWTNPVVRAADRQVVHLVGGVHWEKLTPPSLDNLFVLARYDVGSMGGDEMYRHCGHEHGLVLTGRLLAEIGFSQYVLGPGDSISFASTTPHRFSNIGDEAVTAVWVNQP